METELFERIKTCNVGDPFAAANRNRGDALLSVIAGERASQGAGEQDCCLPEVEPTLPGRTRTIRGTSLGYARSITKRAGGPPAPLLAEGVDEHSRPTLAVDSQGYLHMVMGGHNSPLQYQRSLRPHDASAWTSVEAFGRNTYPVLLCRPNDTLHLMARDGSHNGMEMLGKTTYRSVAKPWPGRDPAEAFHRIHWHEQRRVLGPGPEDNAHEHGLFPGSQAECGGALT